MNERTCAEEIGLIAGSHLQAGTILACVVANVRAAGMTSAVQALTLNEGDPK